MRLSSAGISTPCVQRGILQPRCAEQYYSRDLISCIFKSGLPIQNFLGLVRSPQGEGTFKFGLLGWEQPNACRSTTHIGPGGQGETSATATNTDRATTLAGGDALGNDDDGDSDDDYALIRIRVPPGSATLMIWILSKVTGTTNAMG